MRRGTLRIYLGAAPGVGKTFAMLNEGCRRKARRSADVVIGYVETHGRPATAEQIRDLEVVPRCTIEHRGARFEEMDLDAVLARHPDVALVDELAHSNVSGSRNAKRWEDIDELLTAGIDVISTLNVQHLESLNDMVRAITGATQHETVPDGWVRGADQVELVDMSPEALRRRMAHGNIYQPEKVDAALGNYFRVGNLTALRELALLWVADRVEESLQGYMATHGITASWGTRERVVVALTGSPGGDHLIRRAAQMAGHRHGELLGVHVSTTDGLAADDPEALQRHRRLLIEVGGTYHDTSAADVAEGLVGFAASEHGTQLVLGASGRSRWAELFRGSVINRVVRLAHGIDVHVITSGGDGGAQATPLPRLPRLAALPPRRRALGILMATVGLPLLTAVLAARREDVGLGSVLLLYLALVVVVGAIGGAWPAIGTALLGSLLVNWYFSPPLHRFTVAETENVLAIVVFLGVALVVAFLVDQAARTKAQAVRAQAEARALADVAAAFSDSRDPLPTLVETIRATFDLDAVAVLRPEGDGWRAEASCGDPVPGAPDQATASFPLDGGGSLALVGRPLARDDRLVLDAFTARVAEALTTRSLQAEASHAVALGQANELRTALLAAVSHDLRTPLASIKASATSLLQPDVQFSQEDTRELLTTVDEEVDRLNTLVGNLLDMSRLQTGSLRLVLRPVGLEEVVPTALLSLPPQAVPPHVEVPEDLPRVHADAALLERVVANIVANATTHASCEHPVRIEAGAVPGAVDLRVVDRGPGIRPAERDAATQPFQRLGDSPRGNGVGLGLAVAKGFTEAMGGELTLEDTPGGGLTVILRLAAAETDAAVASHPAP